MGRQGRTAAEATPVVTGGGQDWDGLYVRARRFAAVAADADMDPDDLVQDAMAAMVEHGDGVRRPEAYLYVALHRRVLELRRRRGARRRRLDGVDLGLVGAVVDDHLVELHALLEALHPTDRAVLFLCVVEGWPTARAAEVLGVFDAAVRQRLTRARHRFAAAHRGGGDDAEQR